MRGNKVFTKDEFVLRARLVHGDTYDYPDDYVGANTNIGILCKEHGIFYTTPASHIHAKHRCPQCVIKEVRLANFDKFYKQVENKYQGDYLLLDRENYKDKRSEHRAWCKLHGEYKASISSVLQTNYKGCLQCKVLLEAKEFINKAEKLHQGKYSYVAEDYTCSRTLMKIYCKKHNCHFEQRPSAHIQGQNCPLCGQESRIVTTTKDQEDFLNQVIRVHGDKYDYSEMVYNKAHIKVTVICKKHGRFKITPNNFLNSKNGCKTCVRESMTIGLERFIEDSKLRYGEDTFDYSQAIYVGNLTRLKLKCNLHGEWFDVTPSYHRSIYKNSGCPTCGKLGMNRWTIQAILKIPNIEKKHGFIYIGQIVTLPTDVFKIGITTNLKSRDGVYRRDLGVGIFSYLHTRKLTYLNVARVEACLKVYLSQYFYKQDEKFGGYNEVFVLYPDLYNMVVNVIKGEHDDIVIPEVEKLFHNKDIDVTFLENIRKEYYD